MLACMDNNAHDKEHVYRVLYTALEIADSEENVNRDILIAACLLHDVGRKEQFENPNLCHAEVGARKAFNFLIAIGFEPEFAGAVAYCVDCHRFRGNNHPQTIEAKILFDADKIDVCGTLGIARTLYYNALLEEPIYNLDENGNVLSGDDDEGVSFFQEYKFKLEKIYSKMQTKTGREIAEARRQSAVDFYENLLSEVKFPYEKGKKHLESSVD